MTESSSLHLYQLKPDNMVDSNHPGHLNLPPIDGGLFFPQLLEFNAYHNPDIAHFVYDSPDSDSDDLVSISHLDFYQACHRAAHEIRPGRAGANNEVVALIAQSDTLLYQTVFMGIIFAGWIPFPMSPRNSAAAVVHMMEKTKCHRIITTHHSLGLLIDDIKAGFVSKGTEMMQPQVDEIPALKHLYPILIKGFQIEAFISYPPPISQPSDDDVLFYIHSSGSTGFPKPIAITNLNAKHRCVTPCILEHRNTVTPLCVSAASWPSFHILGIAIQLFLPIASLTCVSIYAPTSLHDCEVTPTIPNSQNILDSVLKTKSNALWAVPAFIEQWVSNPHAVDILKTLEYLAFAGGPLTPKIGHTLVDAGARLYSAYGTTETGGLTCFFRNEIERKLWEWFRFHPNYDIRWAPQDDGTYECQVLASPTRRAAVENIPDVKGYATSDLFMKHPTIEGLWKIVGRMDDVLILSSGEKTVPAPMESAIGASRYVNSTVMFGRARNQVGILIEPRPEYEIDVSDEQQLAEFRNRVWPVIEEANKQAPAFSRIFKEMILVTRADKPMVRAGKGTVIKKATITLYQEEIDALYEKVEISIRAGIDVPLPRNWTTEDVENWLVVHATAANGGKAVDWHTDLFTQGFDSLSATFLKNRIIGSLKSSSDRNIQASSSRIDHNIVFSSPSIYQLARSVINAVLQLDDRSVVSDRADIENMIEKYSAGFGDSARDSSVTEDNGSSRGDHVVVLTGSTGGLGSYLLASLLRREDVSLIYAFNRPSKDSTSSIQQRQSSRFEDRGLDVTLLQSEKLTYVETDTSHDYLGLDMKLYQKICASVTVIIHNAWKLDFNLALSSFEPHIRGARNLIDLALSSPCHPKPRFMFTSSISTARNWDRGKGPFPEEVQYDAGVAEGPGYGASKYVCERVLANSKLHATAFRIGQISGGPPRGAWSMTDWLPIIVKSSVSLGAIPEAQGIISWIPPHVVSNTILDVAFAKHEPPVAVNVVHPRPVAWSTVMRPIADAIFKHKTTSNPLPLIPFSEWLDKLESAAKDANEETMKRIPAIKLLDFIRVLTSSDMASRMSQAGDILSEAGGLSAFSTEVAQRVSPTLRELEPVSASDAAQWVAYWSAVGMFQ